MTTNDDEMCDVGLRGGIPRQSYNCLFRHLSMYHMSWDALPHNIQHTSFSPLPIRDISPALMAASTDSPSSDEKRHGSTDTTNKDAAGKSAMWNKLKGIVWPEWAQEGVKSKRAWKTFVRCMIAVLCTTVLLVDDNCETTYQRPTLSSLG